MKENIGEEGTQLTVGLAVESRREIPVPEKTGIPIVFIIA